MGWWFRVRAKLLAWVVRTGLSLRYSVEVRGVDKIPKTGGILFLSNHPAAVDPFILLSQIGPRFHIRPLALQEFFFLPALRYFLKLIDAFPVPDLSGGANTYKRFRVQEAAEELEKGLRNGERFLVYPSGRLKTGAQEVVGGASLAHQLVRDVPDVTVVLCRIEGLWGSRFSLALTGKRPEFSAEIQRGFINGLKNLIFGSYRRKIVITLEVAENSLRQAPSRLEFNRSLEQFFNQYQSESGLLTEEPLNLIRESIWKRASLPLITPSRVDEVIDTRRLPVEVRDVVHREIATLIHRPVEEIKDSDDLSTQLGMDSLDVAQLVEFLEKRFDVSLTSPAHLKTVGHVVAAAADIQFGEEEPIVPSTWHQDVDERRPEAEPPSGHTCIEAWLRTCDRMGPWEAAGDERTGPKTYDQMKLGVVALAEAFRALPGDRIGVLLPASVTVNIVILALQLAGKVPVMLNWTVGAGPLGHAAELTDLKVVLSALAFLDRLESVDLTPIHTKILLLEELRQQLGLKDLLRAKWRSRKKADKLLRVFGRNQDTGQEAAVILFTSGTEGLPKGVPLTHHNILSNHRSALEVIDLNRKDTMLGSIPSFHSFGFSASGLLPLLGGIRVVFSPDPTNGRALARVCSQWQCTMVLSPPTFLKGLLHAGAQGLLRNVRLYVAGAEKVPEELFNQVKVVSPESQLIEGYGITECSPVLTLNLPGTPRKGVGLPLPGVRLLVVHPDSFEPISFDQMGLVLAAGPNIFPGYLGDSKSPFYEFEGTRWYVTGDLGSVDAAGHLTLSGRLKRFVKIGGEMISLTALEQVLLQAMPQDQTSPGVALKAREEAGSKTTIHAFTTFQLPLDKANALIKTAGFSNLARLTSVKQISSLPLLGSGKINYRGLPDV